MIRQNNLLWNGYEIKLPFVIKIFVLSTFECLFYTGLLYCQVKTHVQTACESHHDLNMDFHSFDNGFKHYAHRYYALIKYTHYDFRKKLQTDIGVTNFGHVDLASPSKCL